MSFVIARRKPFGLKRCPRPVGARAGRRSGPSVSCPGFLPSGQSGHEVSSCEHALALIAAIGREATCPVIAVLHAANREFVASAADAGVFAAVSHDDPDELHGAIVIALRRFAAFSSLNGAFGCRAVIERAKGILMERHGVGEQEAFELLRRQSQHSARKLIDIATAVNDSHRLLPAVTGAVTAGGRLCEVELVDGDESQVRLAQEWPYDVGTRVGIGDSVWRVTETDVPIDPRLGPHPLHLRARIERARELVQSADALVGEATQFRRLTRARRAEGRAADDPPQP